MKKLFVVVLALGSVWAYAADPPGKVIYDKMKCSGCHGKDLKGNPPMAKMLSVDAQKLDLAKAATTAKDTDLKGVLEKGKQKMPAYGKKLKPEEIDSLVAYIRSLAPETKTP